MINTSLRTRINNDKVSSKLELHLLVGMFVLLRVILCRERERDSEREREIERERERKREREFMSSVCCDSVICQLVIWYCIASSVKPSSF